MAKFQRLASIFLLTLLVASASFFLSTDKGYAQSCAVDVIKNAIPADNTPFNFTAVVLGTPEEFVLMDPNNNDTTVLLGLNQSTITEEVPPGWELESIDCVVRDGSEALINFSINGPTVTINCLDSFGQGTCTFNNVLATQNVPTLSQWGLIAMASFLGIVGFMVVRRRKVVA